MEIRGHGVFGAVYSPARTARASGLVLGVVGVHGGAGATTIAYWLSLDPAGPEAVELRPGTPTLPAGCLPVLVAQYTAAGMYRAALYLGTWPPTLPRPWLVVVRDAPLPPPPAAVYRRRALAGRLLGISEVPYLAPLREADTPRDGITYKPVARAAERLRRELPK